MEAQFDDTNAGFLQLVARHLSANAGARTAFLTASDGGEHFFLLATGADSLVQLGEPGAQGAELLDGRGGGAAREAQRLNIVATRPHAHAPIDAVVLRSLAVVSSARGRLRGVADAGSSPIPVDVTPSAFWVGVAEQAR